MNKIIFDDEVWHRTGDAGYIESGKLYLCGRCNQLIRTNESLLSPFIYENNLKLMLGIPATILFYENKVTAVVESSIDRNHDLKIRKRFPEISSVAFVQKFPRDPRHHSKIDYAKLITVLPNHRILTME